MFAQMLKRSYLTMEQTFYIQTWLFSFPDDDPKIFTAVLVIIDYRPVYRWPRAFKSIISMKKESTQLTNYYLAIFETY